MSDEETRDRLDRLRDEYNVPPATPREEMWAVIEAGLVRRDETVVSLDRERTRRRALQVRIGGWAAAAAAALVVGVGIGRMTAPATTPATTASSVVEADPAVLRTATLAHLGRTESLLTLVRADASGGRVDPAVSDWAKGLLTQTRLLLDTEAGEGDPAMQTLLEDLELVLVQIVGVSSASAGDQERARSELALALEGLEQRDVLPRIQAVVPAGPVLAGT